MVMYVAFVNYIQRGSNMATSKFDVYKVLTCLFCYEEVQYIVRSWNVNSCLSDADISYIAGMNLGKIQPHDCSCCKRLTPHKCTAFNRQPL